MPGLVLKARLLPGRVVNTLRDPLYSTGYALVANTLGTTFLGLIYWVVAAHLYDRQALGRCSALVSALMVVSSVAQLDLANTLPRFLPQIGRSSGRLIAYGYGASSIAAVAIGVVFVTVLPDLSAQWHFLRTSPPLALTFVIAAVVWGIFALEDAALTGLRRAVVVPFENLTYGALKLALLAGIASVLPSTGVFIAWLCPLVIIVPAINWLIFHRYLKLGEAAAAGGLHIREIVRFASIDYVGVLLGQACGYVLPLLVLTVLGAAASGSFFIAWTIAAGLELLTINLAMSLLVAGARVPARLAEATRGTLIRCAFVVIPGAAVLASGAHLILGIFGSAYAADASALLGLLGVATIPVSVIMVAFALDRIASKVGRAAITQLALAVLVLTGSLLLIRKLGIDGVGLAWVGSASLVAVARLPTIVRVIKGPADAAALSPGQGEPVRVARARAVRRGRNRGKHCRPE